jgi:hypothetical protein
MLESVNIVILLIYNNPINASDILSLQRSPIMKNATDPDQPPA